MRVYAGTLEGSLTLTEDVLIEGVVIGDVVVSAPANLDVQGLVTGDLILEAGASARVHGRVKGLVTNLGGDLAVFGAIGALSGTGPTCIAAGALVGRAAPPDATTVTKP
jgi:hypothetical protein